MSAFIQNQNGVASDRMLDYFEDNYVGSFHRNGPKGIPMSPIEFWSMFHLTDEEQLPTNNSVWQRGLQSNVYACHSTFWNNAVVLKKNRLRLELQHHFQRRRYVDCNHRILKIFDDQSDQNKVTI